MDIHAMQPHGLALRAYFDGDTSAEVIVRRDDGMESPLPASHFFRNPSEFSSFERKALDCCKGFVLDVGAGTGIHTLVLQERGLNVKAIDIDANAVEVMKRRGVLDAECLDIRDYHGPSPDTILLMGHGIGMAETLSGLEGLLAFLRTIVSRHGQVLFDTLDVRVTNDARHLAYQASNQLAGRYVGETRLQFGFRGITGPWCGWLHVDPETLATVGKRTEWNCEVLKLVETGEFLARLVRE